MATVPTPKNDQITGTSIDETIDALAGSDVVRAGDGNDVVLGNLGNDKLFGEDGADRLSGGQGNDDIDGGDGLDTAVYTGSRDDYQVTTNANGVTEVKDLRSGRPDGIDHVVNTEFFDFNGDVFQLQDGDLVLADVDGFVGSVFSVTPIRDGTVFEPITPFPAEVGSGVEVNINGLIVDVSSDQIYFSHTSGTIPIVNVTLRFDFSDKGADEGAPDIGSISSIDTNISGLDLLDITFDENTVDVNLTGVTIVPDSYFRISIDFV